MKDKEKQIMIKRGVGTMADLLNQEMGELQRAKAIEEMALQFAKKYCKACGCENCDWAYEFGTKEESCEDYLHYKQMAEHFYNLGYQKVDEDKVVISREEYDEYQSFKNGDYCATKCDIHELSFNQMNKISDLENENEELKKEIKNPNEVLEDRERFRARNEELKNN